MEMTDQLPTKLGKEPLIDAVFEVRFSSTAPASDILPGFFFSKLSGCGIIERLPIAQLPKPVRDADPNLQFSPLVRLSWNNFFISIGDSSLVIGCKIPYSGWSNFKPAIIEAVSCAMEIGIIQTVQRFSIKYIDLLSASSIRDQISLIRASVVIGKHTLEQENFTLKIEVPMNGFFHIVHIISSANALLADGSKRDGIIVDIDTITTVNNQEFQSWVTDLPEKLDTIHAANKSMFFECLHPETITSLEPVYE